MGYVFPENIPSCEYLLFVLIKSRNIHDIPKLAALQYAQNSFSESLRLLFADSLHIH